MILSMTEDNHLGQMIITEPELNSRPAVAVEAQHDIISKGPTEAADGDASPSAVATKKSTLNSKQHETEHRLRVMHEILDRKLKKAAEEKSYLFQERANKRRSYNSLRRTLSSNDKSELGDESTLEQMRLQLESLREEKEQVEEEIETTQKRLSELSLIKESPQERAKHLDELCAVVTKEFTSRRKPPHEA